MNNHIASEFVTQTEFTAVMGAIKQDLDRIESNMATKDDLKAFATKEDLARIESNMATKDDLKAFATKEDFKAYATKEDLAAVQKDVENLKQITLQILAIVTTLKA